VRTYLGLGDVVGGAPLLFDVRLVGRLLDDAIVVDVGGIVVVTLVDPWVRPAVIDRGALLLGLKARVLGEPAHA
jgi:hypothetical protein